VNAPAVLTPEERAKAAAFFNQEAAMGEAWGREQTIPATKTIAQSMARYAEASEAVEKQIADRHAAELEAARFNLMVTTAASLFAKWTSSLDNDQAKMKVVADRALRWTKYIVQECEKS